MSQVTVIAKIKAQPDAVKTVCEELQKLVEPTLQRDAGCINYDLHQDNDEPSLFFFIESWESEELLNKHLESEHIKAYLAATEGLIEQWDLNRVTRIS
jgi:quinol monooxygenase YgiN